MVNKVPEIRFAGFKGDWDSGLFKDIIKSIPASRYYSESHRKGEFPVIQQGDNPIAGYADGIPFNNSSDIIVWGDHTRSIYRPISNFFISGDGVRVFKISTKHPNINEILLERYKPASNGYSRHATVLYKSSYFIPATPSEQLYVGQLFCAIDKAITNQEELVTQHKHTFNALLNSLLPHGHETRPRICVGSFSGDWKEKYLYSIVSPYNEIVETPRNGYERLGIRSYGKGTFHSYVPKGAELETAQMSVVRPNNLIVNITFGWELAVAITSSDDEGKLVSHRFPQFSFNEEYVPLFFRYALINNRFRKHLTLASPGSAGRNRVLKIDKMLEYKLLVPSAKEQKAISDILSEYDRLIQLNEEKLGKLRNLKQALLDKMFV